jgi:hypothetical protein
LMEGLLGSLLGMNHLSMECGRGKVVASRIMPS